MKKDKKPAVSTESNEGDTIQVRVSPRTFIKMVSEMTEEQKNGIKLTGFGVLLDFNLKELPYKLGYQIVKSVNHANVSIHLPIGSINITELDVNEVLGLPMGKKQIDTKEKDTEKEELWRKQFDVEVGSRVSAKMILKKMIENRNVDLMFKMNFLVMMSNTFIQTLSNAFVNQRMIKFAGDIDNCKEYNWCKLVVESLLETTPEWKKEPGSKCYAGPIIFLIVLYVDRIVYKGERSVMRGNPAWVGWTDNLLKERSAEELESNAFGKGVLAKGQWEEGRHIGDEKTATRKKVAKRLNLTEECANLPEEQGKIEKDCLQRLEASASRLIQALSTVEADMSACSLLIPNNPRHKEITKMVTKMVTKFLHKDDRRTKQKIDGKGKGITGDKLGTSKSVRVERNDTTIGGDSDQILCTPKSVEVPMKDTPISGVIIKEVEKEKSVEEEEIPNEDVMEPSSTSLALTLYKPPKSLRESLSPRWFPPSFSLGLTQSTDKESQESEEAVADISRIAQFYAEDTRKKDKETVANVSTIAQIYGDKGKEKSVKGKEKSDSDVETLATTTMNEKREGKPSEFIKSPFRERKVDLETKKHMDHTKMWNWVFNSGEPKE